MLNSSIIFIVVSPNKKVSIKSGQTASTVLACNRGETLFSDNRILQESNPSHRDKRYTANSKKVVLCKP